MHDAPLIETCHRVQTILIEYVEIRQAVGIEALLGQGQLNDIPAGGGIL
jgi:hypothetical protein